VTARPRAVDLTTTIGSVTLPNPVMTASGTSGHGAELVPYLDLSALGAVVVKSLSAEPWEGNPPLRVVLWNGQEIVSGDAAPSVTMAIRNRAALWRLLRRGPREVRHDQGPLPGASGGPRHRPRVRLAREGEARVG